MFIELIKKNRRPLAIGFTFGGSISIILLLLALYTSASGLSSLSAWLDGFSSAELILTCIGLVLLSGISGAGIGVAIKYAWKQLCLWLNENNDPPVPGRPGYNTISNSPALTEDVPLKNDDSNGTTLAIFNNSSFEKGQTRTLEADPDFNEKLEQFKQWGNEIADMLYIKAVSDGKEAAEILCLEKMTEFKNKRKPLLWKYHTDKSGSNATKASCQDLLEVCQEMMNDWELAVVGNIYYKKNILHPEEFIIKLKNDFAGLHKLSDFLLEEFKERAKEQEQIGRELQSLWHRAERIEQHQQKVQATLNMRQGELNTMRAALTELQKKEDIVQVGMSNSGQQPS